VPFPFERRALLRGEAALLVDGLLAQVARGRGALDVAMGEVLAELAVGDRVLRLGYSGIGDYGRERLGVAGRTTQALARLGRELQARPLLRQAVRRGELTPRQAQAVLPAAVGAEEARWVERARGETVRALEAAVREETRGRAASAGPAGRSSGGAPGSPADGAGGSPEDGAGGSPTDGVGGSPTGGSLTDGDEEAWDHVLVPMSPASREKLDEALELAGRQLGAAAPRWQRLEVVCQEFLGAHPETDEVGGGTRRPGGPWDGGEPGGPGGGAPGESGMEAAPGFGSPEAWTSSGAPSWARGGETRGAFGPGSAWPLHDEALGRPDGARWLESLKADLEEETRRWAALAAVAPVAAPDVADVGGDPGRLDAELRRLASMRDRWDELVGHLGMLVRTLGLWRDMEFATFGHYCAERLGMGERTVEQRAWLERRLHELPALREAMREGRLSYEKARVVAGCADEGTAEAWIEKAEGMTCVALRREVEAEEEAQACARGDFALRLPRRVNALLMQAFRAARRGSRTWLTPERCLVRLAEHFIETWGAEPRGRSTPGRRAVERDGGHCQVPGCSRAAAHAHHVRFRSRGGKDEAGNLVALCAAHHLHGVHRGWVRVSGRAPDALRWELGERGALA
jgi:hypothetical protein